MRSVKIKTKNLATLFFSLFLTLAVFSQISVANPKPTSDVSLNKADWLYYKSNNDITAYLGKKSSNLPTVRYQKGADHLEFSMTGVSSTTSVSLETNIKEPNTPTLFYRNVFDGVDANYQITKLPFRVKEEIVLNQNRHPMSVLGQTFTFSAETSAKPVKQKDGSIAFFDGKGDYLFQLDKPFMIDAKGNRSEDVSIEIVSVGETKPSQKNNGFNFKFRNSNFESIFNDLIFKHLNIPSFIQNSKFKIQNFNTEYQILLKADNQWLNDPSRVYPVIIDPTVTHNADANFTGQMNRIADADTTSSTQLESSYPEATKDPYTVLLLHFNEANGATAGIRDYASTTRIITANGNASTTSYVTQLGMGNSAAFDGTGDYFTVPDSDDFNFGSGDFSIDFWVNFTDLSTHRAFFEQYVDTNNFIGLYLHTNTNMQFNANVGGVYKASYYFPWIPSLNTYYHIAVERNGINFKIFINGISQNLTEATAISTNTMPNLAAALTVGFLQYVTPSALHKGYLDEFRILKGRALTPEEIKASASRRPYSVYTSSVLDASASVQWDTLNWTEGGVKTGDGETLYNSSGLVAQWNFNETSGTTATSSTSGSCQTCAGTLNGFAYTASQDQATTTTGWTANNKKWGGGGLMMESPAAADYVSITDPASNVLDPNSADLTIETWIKTSDTSAEIFSNNNANGTACTNNGYYLGIDASGYPVFYLDTNGATAGCDASITSQFKINDGNWHKVSVSATRGTSAVIYVDGKSAGSDTSVTSYSAITVTGNAYFGGSAGGLDAILDSTRFYSRTLSASEILSNYNAGNIEIQTRTGATSDPNDGTWEAWKPTTGETQLLSMDSDQANWNAPQQIDGYTKLLLHMDGTDAATTFPNSATTTHAVTAVNQAQVDTAQSKFGGGSYLGDGTADYLNVANSADWAFNADFTIDFWVRFNSVASEAYFVDWNGGADIRIAWSSASSNLVLDMNGSTQHTFPWSPATNKWYHLAIARSGSNLRAFVNGVQIGTTKTDSVSTNQQAITIGASYGGGSSLNGWLDELRISKGVARWTSNFTPPPRAYGSNVKADNETTLKMEGTGSAKLTLGAPQIDGNTVALWHFEETGTTTGTYLYDETANNNDATTTGTTVVDGIFGKARKFDRDYASVASTGFPSGANSRTIMAWAKPDVSDANVYYVYAYGSAFAGQVFGLSNNNGTWLFQGNGSGDLNSGVAVVPGKWIHTAVTYDGTTVRIYLDGKEVASGAKTLNTVTNYFYISRCEDGCTGSDSGFKGLIDEMQVLNRVLSPDEIAETYRMGANHHLTRQVSATDLSAQTKLAFNIASDRPGTYLDAMLGESDYANYELASSTLALSTTTVLYIKGDEIASSTSIKDSSFSGKAITANGNARTAGNGKIGNSMYFDGTGDYLTTPDSDDFTFGTGDFSIDFWMRFNSVASTLLVDQWNGASLDYQYIYYNGTNLSFESYNGGSVANYYFAWTPVANTWYHISVVRNGTNLYIFKDGVSQNLTVSQAISTNSLPNLTQVFTAGGRRDGNLSLNGYLDELRIIKGTALTPDQIRQAYEYGLRSHQITIDFGATLQTSDLISNSTDYNFNITATTSGLSATTSGLYLGDKIIIKENLGGTEYAAQGTVNAINTTTGAITVPSWDTGSTFPASNGYSPNATVFKWQREYFDLTGSLSTHRDAITNLTIRPTNGAEGRTVYLDDFKHNTNYLTASSSSAITSSNNRYLQYRAIFSSWDSFVSPYLSAINTLYTSTANMFAPLIGVSGGGFLSF